MNLFRLSTTEKNFSFLIRAKRLFKILQVCVLSQALSCAHVKTPAAYIRPSWQLLTTRATLQEAQNTKARVYFRTKDAEVYEMEYHTKNGSAFFHKYVLADRIYEEIPEGEYAVWIRAVQNGEKSHWKKISTR